MAVATYLHSVLEDLRGKGLAVPLAFPEEVANLDTVSLQSLLKGNVLKTIISDVADHMHTSNQMAAASLFQKRYAYVLLTSVIHPLLYAGIGILADPEQTDVMLDDGLPVGIKLRNPSQWMPIDVADGFFPSIIHTALDRNLKELIDRISSEIGVSPLILWENAGSYVRFLHQKIGNDRELRFPSQRVFCVLFDRIGMYAPALASVYRGCLTEEPDAAECVRTTCCLWYQFPGNSPCPTCPRLKRN
ncbi:hypothetical protein JQC72_13660 [Polycladomyces sp. WAk]|uniref:Aerobactin siderophore biosynthesis IucA/IucC-like C-terminal domain-containing protein n=1 Tax=Polycladomyces zharkentensis TaxID=2807616 RepID=A0ABS2WLY9_9BACL|nr:ferric iron reductase [Polycladomyces sp. WAk]MBN2910548.1 hypothetical protein [Polycladomyces sp. WAk]